VDRRQRKTREAIFKAFIFLLSKKNFNHITVGEIIQLADVGRATFYAHFETKDFLLKDLCAELFDHLFETDRNIDHNIGSEANRTPNRQQNQDQARGQHNIFCCDAQDFVFLHLFRHIKKNDNNIAKLLSSKNNELFLEYFKNGVKRLVSACIEDFQRQKPPILPEDFWVNHITATFIETLRWWLENKMQQSPELITEYFLQAVSSNIQNFE